MFCAPNSHRLSLPSGERLTVRPAGPGDEEMLQAYVRRLSANARYDRFFGALYELPPAELARVTHMNGPKRATLIAEIHGPKSIMIGELRYAVLPYATCEFALSVADEWRGKGLGSMLIENLQLCMRALGVEKLVGDVLRSNRKMLAFADKAGFGVVGQSGDPRAVRIVKDISASQAGQLGMELTKSACDRNQFLQM